MRGGGCPCCAAASLCGGALTRQLVQSSMAPRETTPLVQRPSSHQQARGAANVLPPIVRPPYSLQFTGQSADGAMGQWANGPMAKVETGDAGARAGLMPRSSAFRRAQHADVKGSKAFAVAALLTGAGISHAAAVPAHITLSPYCDHMVGMTGRSCAVTAEATRPTTCAGPHQGRRMATAFFIRVQA
jgi:hypothetical protein